MSSNKGYILPAIIDPPETVCIRIEVPNDANHIYAFWGALDTLGIASNWDWDGLQSGKAAAIVWRDVVNDARLTWGDCDMSAVTNIRIVDCNLEALIDEVWTVVADLSSCITTHTAPIQSQVDDNETDITGNALDIGDNTDDIDDLEDADPEINSYPPPPTQAGEPDELCGSAWYIAEQLEALCQDALIQSQTLDVWEWLEAILSGGGWQTVIVLDLWELAVANINPTLDTDLSDAIEDIAKIIYCEELDKAAIFTAIQDHETLASDVKTFYETALTSAKPINWDKWVFLGTTDLSHNCDDFCEPDVWCYEFNTTTGFGSWVIEYGEETVDGIDTEFLNPNIENRYIQEARAALIVPSGSPVTKVEMDFWIVYGAFYNSNHLWNIWSDETETFLARSFGSTWTNEQIYAVHDPAIGQDIEVRIRVGANIADAADIGSMRAYIQRIRIYGTGSNPYGADNC